MKDQKLACQVTLLGHLVSKQNTVRYFADGTAILLLDMVVKKTWTTAQGEQKIQESFFTVRALDQLAQEVALGLQAGDAIFVQGMLGKYLDATQIRIAGKNNLYWNQAYCCGEVVKIEHLKTVNDLDYTKVHLQLEHHQMEVNLRGKTAQLMRDKLSLQSHLLVEGAISSKSTKVKDAFERHYWLDGHTCVCF